LRPKVESLAPKIKRNFPQRKARPDGLTDEINHYFKKE
jgi:hypothetical protein